MPARLNSILKVWLGYLFNPAEDPRQTFEHSYERQRTMLNRVQHALNEIGETKRRLETKAEELDKKLLQLQSQASDALRAGREDRARLALERRAIGMIELDNLREQFQQVELEQNRLALVESRLSSQIEAFYSRLEVIEARHSAAAAQVQIQEALTGLSDELSDLGQVLEETEQRTSRMQAKAYAIDRLVEEGMLDAGDGPDITSQPTDLASAPSIEHQLSLLKAELERNG